MNLQRISSVRIPTVGDTGSKRYHTSPYLFSNVAQMNFINTQILMHTLTQEIRVFFFFFPPETINHFLISSSHPHLSTSSTIYSVIFPLCTIIDSPFLAHYTHTLSHPICLPLGSELWPFIDEESKLAAVTSRSTQIWLADHITALRWEVEREKRHSYLYL